MSLTIIGPLDELNAYQFRTSQWQFQPGTIQQRSLVTGRTRRLQLGPAGRWTCEVEVVPTRDTAALNSRRNGTGALSLINRATYMTAVEVAQAASPVPATCQVDGAGQAGFTLNLKGLAAGITNLVAGQLISVDLGSGDEQLFVLREADLVAGAGGLGTATLHAPLRRSPANNATVRLHWPRAVMRIEAPLGWTARPGIVYEFPTFSAEEAF